MTGVGLIPPKFLLLRSAEMARHVGRQSQLRTGKYLKASWNESAALDVGLIHAIGAGTTQRPGSKPSNTGFDDINGPLGVHPSHRVLW